ncbi:MAG: PP2C family protein-serine/threonine phosphatase [Terriglobia bacterium]
MSSTQSPDWGQRLANFGEALGEELTALIGRAQTFWQRVSDGQRLQELWADFRAEAQASYKFYSKDVDWEALESSRGAMRALKIGQALFWAMLMKLSPARRVFLLIACVFIVLAIFGPGSLYIVMAIASLLFLLALELGDRVTMKRDLEIAREIQHWLVPEKPPQLPGLDIAFRTRPQNTVAGDYYDAFLRSDDPGSPASRRLLLVVADVAGKSVPAALLMATFQASLQTLAAAPTTLLELVLALNRYACAHSLGGARFTTAFLAELDLDTRALTYVSAGHNPPVLRRASGGVDRLEAGGLPLGIRANASYESGGSVLKPGDLLVIFTDGVVEAENSAGDEYGEDRMMGLLAGAVPGESAAATLNRLMTSVDTFVGATRQHDDITCLVLWCA